MEHPTTNMDFFGCFEKLKKRTPKPAAIVIHHTCTSTPKATRHGLKM